MEEEEEEEEEDRARDGERRGEVVVDSAGGTSDSSTAEGREVRVMKVPSVSLCECVYALSLLVSVQHSGYTVHAHTCCSIQTS